MTKDYTFSFALESYILHPERFPKEVLYYDSHASIVHDGFPKSSFHILVLPRDLDLTLHNPNIALTSSTKRKYEKYIRICSDYIFHEFNKLYRLNPVNISDNPWFNSVGEIRNKRLFFKNFIQVGIHSVPSMSNLHIHVLTKDFNNEKLKRKRHFNSFNTDFFVKWENLPLAHAPLDEKKQEIYYNRNHHLICNYCHDNFKDDFGDFKKHITQEFEKYFIRIGPQFAIKQL
ncbi:hypothetical protein TBLA_0B03650 [Henningerozyma blattae CBS 6284]|uniref:Uncharacterized protein n=1 Tax=Henningerozyma blattae (strain ATCC 34711 / CBS 6284 / DSM 70876 / NBRC 10599 / NRRL Y-10934 / UCD 77-7) TaxID=1071380 RepID=I2GYK2_HENB6|nr:hypothetical protein TBLA_0B03650 [Tetrapisispora blattae CBS 6284]CCH59204.1 hypothetical protein TBLA_0B03650 [Tetrapisispora blattae CBS 6284]